MWNEGLFWTVWRAQPGNFSSHYAAFSKGQPRTLRTGHCCSTPLCEFWLPIPFTINIANISGLLPIYRSWLWIYLFKIYRQYIGTGCTRSAVKILKVSTISQVSNVGGLMSNVKCWVSNQNIKEESLSTSANADSNSVNIKNIKVARSFKFGLKYQIMSNVSAV